MWEKVKAYTKKNKFLVKPFLVLFAIYFIGMLAIILASVNYADDIGRTERGYAGWAYFSRYISEIGGRIIHADNYLTNIAPLPQILSAVVLAISSVMLLVVVCGKEKFKQPWTKWIWQAIAVIPLGLSPYMLECLSYQYDSIYMAMSVFFAVLPLLFYNRDTKWFAISMIVGVLGVCTTYQPAIGIIPMLIVFLAIRDWNDKEKFLKKSAIGLLVFLVTLFVFQKFLMIPQDGYVSNGLPALSNLIPETLEHLKQYFVYVWTDFKLIWTIVIAVMIVLFVIYFSYVSKRNKALATGVSVIGVLCMAVAIFIIYSLLDKPLYTTRAMYGVGAFIAVIGIYIVGMPKSWVTKIPVFIICWCFFVFAFTYGNALKVQDEYRNNKINMVVADLNSLSIMQDGITKTIQATGGVGLSPIITHMPQNYQMLNRLLEPSFEKGIIWDTYRLVYLCDVGNLTADLNVDLTKEDLPVLKSTVYYDIKGTEDKILVVFKESHRD